MRVLYVLHLHVSLISTTIHHCCLFFVTIFVPQFNFIVDCVCQLIFVLQMQICTLHVLWLSWWEILFANMCPYLCSLADNNAFDSAISFFCIYTIVHLLLYNWQWHKMCYLMLSRELPVFSFRPLVLQIYLESSYIRLSLLFTDALV